MQDPNRERELEDRLQLIETMIAEGRSNTESWGWVFVLWGLAYYVALAWSAWGHSNWAWPVTVSITVILTAAVSLSRSAPQPKTTLGRAIGSIWIAVGISMFLLFLALGLSGRLVDQHLFMAVLSAMLAVANASSALVLRWKVQFLCALVWWATTVAACFGGDAQSRASFLIAIFLCQVAFGVYAMISEEQRRKRMPNHA